MGNIADLKIGITATSSGYTEAIDKATSANKKLEQSSHGVGSGLKSLTSLALAGGAFVGLSLGIKDVYDGFEKEEKANAITNARLAATKGISGETADGIRTLAETIQNKTGIDREQVQSSENMLLGFTSVQNKLGDGNDIFTRATEMTANLSVAMGIDAPSAARMLGLALDDPATGLTRLKRAGVDFSDQQKNQIKTLEKSGNTLGAQRMILDALDQKYHDVADSVGGTTAGKISIFTENLRDGAQTILGMLMPALDRLSSWLVGTVVPAIQNALGYVQHLWDVFKKNGINGVLSTIKGDIDKTFGSWAAGIFSGIVLAIKGVIDVIDWLRDHTTAAKAIIIAALTILGVYYSVMAINATAAWIKSAGEAFGSAAKIIAAIARIIARIVVAIASSAAAAVATVASWIAQAASAVASAVVIAAAWILAYWPVFLVIAIVALLAYEIITHWQQIKAFTEEVFSAVWGFLTSAWDTIKSVVTTAINFVLNFVKEHWRILIVIFMGPIGLIIDFVTAHFNTIKTVIMTAITTIGNIISWLWHSVMEPLGSFIAGVFTAAWHLIEATIRAFWSGVLVPVGNAFLWLYNSVITPVANAISGVFSAAWNTLQSAISSVWNGVLLPIGSAFSSLWNNILVPLGNYISQALAAAWSALQSAMQTFKSAILDPIMGVFNDMESVLGRIAGALDSVIGKIGAAGSALGKVGGVIGNVLGITGGSATGGMVGLNGPEIRLVGEEGPEYVVPNNMLGSFFGRTSQTPAAPVSMSKVVPKTGKTGGGGHTFNLTVNAAEKSTADDLYKMIKDKLANEIFMHGSLMQ